MTFRPLYKRLAEKVSAQILAENLKDGDFFCTLNDLCEKYIASITTVRKTVALLTAQDIISCKAGEGITIRDIESLRRMVSLRCRVLLLHHHYRKKLNDFFELRLSALVQGFSTNDIATQVIYREALNDESTLAFYWQSSTGIVCGNSMVGDVLAACQEYGMRQVLVINPPANVRLPPNFHPVFYDFAGLIEQSQRFWRTGNCRKIVMLRNEYNIIPPSYVDVIDLEEYPSVEVGRVYGERLWNESSDTGFWVTDDFVGLGLYDYFRGRGVDLNESKRLLVNSSPSRVLTDELGIAAIGFCPMRIGEEAAAHFSRILKEPDDEKKVHAPLIISAEASMSAFRHNELPDAST
nr:GntR family transcriptional regulator [Victivallis vadensis]